MTMSEDDPRGHDDGDVFVDDPERASILRVELKKLILDLRRNHLLVQGVILQLAEEMGYSPDEIADELEAEAAVLRHKAGVKKR